RDRGDVVGGARELRRIVVEAGYDQGDELEPQAALVHHPDRVEDVLQHTTELAVAFVVHRLEVDLVTVGPRPDVVEDFGRGVPVGDERRLEPVCAGDLEDVHRPVGGNQRPIVRR